MFICFKIAPLFILKPRSMPKKAILKALRATGKIIKLGPVAKAKKSNQKKPEVRNPIFGYNLNPRKYCRDCGGSYSRDYHACPNCAQLRRYQRPELMAHR